MVKKTKINIKGQTEIREFFAPKPAAKNVADTTPTNDIIIMVDTFENKSVTWKEDMKTFISMSNIIRFGAAEKIENEIAKTIDIDEVIKIFASNGCQKKFY